MTGTLTLAVGGSGHFALDLLVILACAGVTAVVLGRLRIAVIPGYLIAGALVGPSGIGLISDVARVDDIVTTATVLLMFSIGMHLDTSSLRRGAVWIVMAGVLSTLASTTAVGGASLLFGVSVPTALGLGMAMSMSSTAVVLRLLQSRRELYAAHGRTSLGVLLVQDLLVVIMLAMVPVLARAGGAGDGAEAGTVEDFLADASIAIAGVAGLIIVGKLGLPRLMRVVAVSRQDELLLVVSAAAALGAAIVSGALGLSPELGAFIAGFILSSTPFRHQLSGQITPIRDLFMAVFFTVVGMHVNLALIQPHWWVVLVGVVGVLGLKALSIGLSAWICGAATPVAARTGLALSQGGEFTLLVVSVAAGAGLFDETVQAVAIAIVVVTLIATPSMVQLAARVGAWSARVPPAPWFRVPPIRERPAVTEADTEGEDDEDHGARVIIAGFGPVGRACSRTLTNLGVRHVVIEMNARTVWAEAQRGAPLMYGDVTNLEVLENAGIERAEVVVLTMPDRDAMLRAVRTVRRVRPDVHLAARVILEHTADQAKALGADEVVVEETAAAETLASSLASRLGTEGEAGVSPA